MDWKRFFDRIGLDGTRWQWRIRRWQTRWADWIARASDRRRQVTYAHKVCPECGALMARNEPVCPSCHARAGTWSGQVAGRTVRSLVPAGVVVAPALLALNVIIAVMTMIKPGTLDWNRLLDAGFIHGTLLREGEWWRLVSYGFLHGNLLHIVFNMMGLYQLGPLIETEVGRRRFLSLYVLTLIAAGCATAFLRTGLSGGSIGASGAIFGLVGFGLAYSRMLGRAAWYMAFRSMTIQSVIFGVYIQFAGNIRIDNLAHGGGFVAGLALGALMGLERRSAFWTGKRRSVESAWNWLASGALLVTTVSVGAMFVEFVRLLRG